MHLHTPSSYDYQNKSITNEDIIQKLKERNISAAVISDHHIIDFKRITELNILGGENIHFFRGIETTTNLGGKSTIHIIAIFPDDISEERIKQKILYPLDLLPEEVEKMSDTEKQSIYVSFDNFVKYAHECDALVSIHAGHKSNSIENIGNLFLSKRKQKTDMLHILDILETGKPEDVLDYEEKVFPSTDIRLPIIIGSDNHDISKYTNPPTWIKADVTFEGLKQITYEPELRVKVQELNPDLAKPNTYLETISIKDTKMFNSTEITFNKNLVSIIGEKGSGKTALLDIISVRQ